MITFEITIHWITFIIGGFAGFTAGIFTILLVIAWAEHDSIQKDTP